ncbi:MAG: winged helix-turn-helix domain-containing protein [Clostridia bacterium]|nr:winged helix-turn-helix domain-containing protein [Clostridia bacterium]
MSIESNITVGTIAIVKVGRNEVEVTVTEVTATGWKVKSQSTGREFEVRRIERIVTESAEETEAAEPETAAPAEPETEEEDNAVNPAPESGSGARPEKKLSLLNAAAKVLAACRTPMNCKEMIAKAVEMGLWTPTGAKTPEQTLYSGIFREIKSTEEPRFRKSETRKGSFEYAK